MTADDVRRLALGQDGAVEQDHHGFPSYRVSGRIFATQPDGEHLHVMLDPGRVAELLGDAARAKAGGRS